MPQLDKSSFLNQVLWLLIFIIILYFIIILVVLPTIHKVISMRKLILTNIIQKGYIFSHQIIKSSKHNEMFNYMLIFFNSVTFLNILVSKKLTLFIQKSFEQIVLSNLMLTKKN